MADDGSCEIPFRRQSTLTCIPNSAHEDVEASNHDPDVDVEEPDHKPDQKVEVKLYMAGSRIYAYMIYLG